MTHGSLLYIVGHVSFTDNIINSLHISCVDGVVPRPISNTSFFIILQPVPVMVMYTCLAEGQTIQAKELSGFMRPH